MKTNTNLGLLILRITLGGLMLFHGVAKLGPGITQMAEQFSTNGMPGFIAYFVFLGELLAPILLIIGFRTKLSALVYAFTMLAAIFIAHTADIFTINQYGGWAIELPFIYMMGAVALMFTGGGKYAISKTNKWD